MGASNADESLIRLREGELAKLIRLTEGTRDYLALAFGIGWVALKWRESEWALEHIAQWRGLKH